METVVEEKLDRFANDYYKFLALRYDLIPDLRVKVVHCRSNNWGTNIPSQRIIVEPPTVHNYEAQEALEHFNRFVAWVGLDETIDRYVPCK